MASRDGGLRGCDGDSGGQRGCRRAKYWPPTGVGGNSGNGRCGRVCREARV